MTIKQQTSVPISNPEPKMLKTKGFPIVDISCCGSSTSIEIIN